MTLIPVQVKAPYTAIHLTSDAALDLLKEIELLRLAAPVSYDISVVSGHMLDVMTCFNRFVLRMSSVSERVVHSHLFVFITKTRTGYYRGACTDWYFRSVQALIANAAGFPDRASWSALVANMEGVPATSL